MVRDLGQALFHQTVVTRAQHDTLKKAVQSRASFEVRDE